MTYNFINFFFKLQDLLIKHFLNFQLSFFSYAISVFNIIYEFFIYTRHFFLINIMLFTSLIIL